MLDLKSLALNFIIIILFLNYQHLTDSVIIKFTKFQCFAFDKPFADIPKCYLKVLARDKVALNLYVRLHQVPITNISVNAEFFVKDSTQSYHPFLYNSTADFCKFSKNPNRLPFWKIVWNIVKTASNINHTCPYDHDVYVKNLTLDGNMLKTIPFPSGEYLVVLRVMAYNHVKAEIRSYIFLRE